MGKGHFVYILSFDMIMINVALSKKHQLYSMQKAKLFANIHYFYFINHKKKTSHFATGLTFGFYTIQLLQH